MLLSCIYTFVYFENIALLRGVTNGQHGKKGTEILCASCSEVGRWYCNLFSCTFVLLSCYYGFINFLGEGRKWAREKDTSDERVLWSASPLALPARPNQVQENRRQASSSPARALTPSPILFELGSVHLSPYTCLLASNGLESTLNKSLIQPHYIVASATTNSDVGGVAASGRWQ